MTLGNHPPGRFDDGPNYPILHEDGAWRLYRVTYTQPPQVRSYIGHMCPDRMKSVWRWSIANMDLPCPECGETPPDEMVGLYKLHNWDYLRSTK